MNQRLASVGILVLGLAAALGEGARTRSAEACGGPEYADLGALDPVDAIVGRMSLSVDDGWDVKDREELRFLEPFRRERPQEIDPLWAFSYDGATPAAIVTAELDRALAGKDVAAQKVAAERFIADWLALPPVAGSAQKPALERAATALDPTAAKELLAIEKSIQQGIPNGWRDDVRKKFSRADALALERPIDAFRARYPKHPLAPYAALWKVRTRYFSGDDAGAYEAVFSSPASLRVRALAEARFLLLHDVRPSAAQLDAQRDVAWVAGFADRHTIDEPRFARWWPLAESEIGRKASVALEERLLYWVATRPGGAALPAKFPADARAPTPFWGEMRAAALIRSGDTAAALAQLAKLPAKDAARPDLEASAHLGAKHPERAAQVTGLGADARSYILAVLVATPDLEKLAQTTGPAGAAPRLELALRTGAAGDWRKAAAILEKDDPTRARDFRKIADLRASRAARGELELARMLDGKAGALLDAPSRPYYRALSARYDPKQRPAEAQAIEQAMQRRSERYQALAAYVAWLEKNPTDAEARVAITEADATYNRLVNFSGDDQLFWGRHLPRSDLAKRLRAAGKAVRAAVKP